MDIFKLSRNWFNWCFDNPEKVSPNHTAIYFFALEHCNRLGWKQKFGFPSQMAMEAVGIKNWRTFIKAFNDIIDWGFIKLIEKSKNQYSSNIIAIVENTKANTEADTKALDKALQKHSQKQCKSIVGIDIQETILQETKKQVNIEFDVFWNLYDKKVGDKTKLQKKWEALKDQERTSAIEYIPRYKSSQPDKKYRKNPETFLNNKSWNDEIITGGNIIQQHKQSTAPDPLHQKKDFYAQKFE